MDRTLELEQAMREFFQERFVSMKSSDEFRVQLVVDEKSKRFLLMNEGWFNYRRVYGPIVDASLRNGKVWIHEDNTQTGIVDDLLKKGVQAHEIVLGWQPEYKRELTGFAVS